MNFNPAYFSEDDIAQLSSAPGAGHVGVLRLSGANAFSILARAASGLDAEVRDHPRRGVFRCDFFLTFESGAERAPCPALAFLMPGPASYTRENIVEFHLPGAPIVLRAALSTLADCGARPAAAGEFTFRAFRNGRVSLGQAEAVEESIRAQNEDERKIALFRLGGANTGKIREWRTLALGAASLLEASIDFGHDALGEDPAERIGAIVDDLIRNGVQLGRKEGIARPDLPLVALVGLANAGKSSLANALLAAEEFLVSPLPSTTRDRLIREVEWRGTKLSLADTPGHDPESAGGAAIAAARGQESLGAEDIACWVVDGSTPLSERAGAFAARLKGKVLVLLNKCDLPAKTTPEEALSLLDDSAATVEECLSVSARTGTGIDRARQAIASRLRDASPPGRWNRRENMELEAALSRLRAAGEELAGPGRAELAAEDLRSAVLAFSAALGEGYAEEVLTTIFSRFCLGK
ncbi:MAG: 50S ribosome-binding GTPase [Planctomycetota bacterium]|jgi:tRNA modification GTPase|nr:50S ribosome-binding GTPase [Planctomycetota bacterium]